MRDSGSSEISAGGEPGKLRRYEKPDAIEIHTKSGFITDDTEVCYKAAFYLLLKQGIL